MFDLVKCPGCLKGMMRWLYAVLLAEGKDKKGGGGWKLETLACLNFIESFVYDLLYEQQSMTQ